MAIIYIKRARLNCSSIKKTNKIIKDSQSYPGKYIDGCCHSFCIRIFIMKKTKIYMDKLMENKEFREKFDEEYQNLCIEEKIAEIRHQANLTQDVLAKRTHTTKSAISRYENSDYKSYSMPLLNKIAEACGTVLKIDFVAKETKKG